MTAQVNRKPAPLHLATPYPTDREKIWAAIRSLKEFTARRLEKHSGASIGKVRDYIWALTAAGIVAATNDLKPGVERTYRLMQDRGADAPRVRKDGTLLHPEGRTRMWQAMAVLYGFTPVELAHAASLPEAPVAVREAEYYCRWLERGGYLLVVNPVGPRYTALAVRRHGPKAPQIQRVKRLYDPNTGEIVGTEDVVSEGGEA